VKFLRDESGQAITEYLLILSVAVATALTFSRGILKGISDGVLSLGGQLEKDLKTGRMRIEYWKN
jgi:Flp pilus assembly pilin Flp